MDAHTDPCLLHWCRIWWAVECWASTWDLGSLQNFKESILLSTTNLKNSVSSVLPLREGGTLCQNLCLTTEMVPQLMTNPAWYTVDMRPEISFNPLQDLRQTAPFALCLPEAIAAVVAVVEVVVVVGSFSQQSSPSPQEQLSVPQTRSPSHSLSASQSPSRLPDGKIWSLPFLGLRQLEGVGRNPRKGRDQILQRSVA